MPTVDILNMDGKKVSEINLKDEIFAAEVKPYLLHDYVIWQLSNKRSATAKTKTRSEVSGGGAKPWKQKGTGRARAGTNRSPLWRKGGVIFGPNGRKYDIKLTKKLKNAALRSALSLKMQESSLLVIDDVKVSEVKTKAYVKALENLEMCNTLIVMGDLSNEMSLVSRNHNSSKVLDVKGLNIYDILKYKGIILDVDAIKYIEERL